MITAIYALIVAVMLVVPSPAWAECAWVLWERKYSLWVDEKMAEEYGKESTDWKLPVARQTQAECEDVLRRAWESMLRQNQPGPEKPGIKEVKSAPGFIAVTLQTRGGGLVGFVTHDFVCLPDTIDPRGPKGGTR